MRKSLQKTPPSALNSRLAPLPAALAAVDAEQRSHGVRRNGSGGFGTARAAVLSRDEDERLAARARLLEGFVIRTDITECARFALRWLADTVRVGQSLCLVQPTGEAALFAVADMGLSGRSAAAFSVSLDDWNNPLVGIVHNGTQAFFPAAHSAADRRRRPSTPFED